MKVNHSKSKIIDKDKLTCRNFLQALWDSRLGKYLRIITE